MDAMFGAARFHGFGVMEVMDRQTDEHTLTFIIIDD